MSGDAVIGIVSAGRQKYVITGDALGDLVVVSVRCNGELLFALHAADLNDGFCDALDLIRDEVRVRPAGEVWGVLELVAS